MKIVVLGSSGMLGNSIYKNLSESAHRVFGLQRSPSSKKNILSGLDVSNLDKLELAIKDLSPDLVINCIGVIKQVDGVEDVVNTVSINSQLPHQLAEICEKAKSKLIHFSTDCIFDGTIGNYTDDSPVSAKDTYGLSKYLGEVKDKQHVLTVRTSIIGHGINPNNSLVDWFLKQQNKIVGFSEAYFSGLPCCEISDILENHIIGSELFGLYNLSADRISKFDLLTLVKEEYELDIEIVPSDNFRIDRSLDSKKFRETTGFLVKPWKQLIKEMKNKDFNR